MYDEMLLKIQEGDVITSKKGTITQHPITKEWFLIKKFKYHGNGHLTVIGDKEPMNVTKHQHKETSSNASYTNKENKSG